MSLSEALKSHLLEGDVVVEAANAVGQLLGDAPLLQGGYTRSVGAAAGLKR